MIPRCRGNADDHSSLITNGGIVGDENGIHFQTSNDDHSRFDELQVAVA